MKEILRKHADQYPQMKIQDAVKLLFQSEFGPGHLIKDVELARKLLVEELIETKQRDPEIVPVSEDLVRLHLGQMDESFADMILDAMVTTANEVQGSMDCFLAKLNELKEFNALKADEIDAYLKEYLNGASLVVSHTDVYRTLYHPHYRILKKELAEKIIRCIR